MKKLEITLQAAFGFNQIKPGRYELKRMVNLGLWEKLGQIFNFTPVYLGTSIDWRCVPKALYEQLQKKGNPGDGIFQPPRERTIRPGKKLQHKTVASMGTRERLYCAQSAYCHYCQNGALFEFWTVDHKIPLCRGGNSHATNLVGCCLNCNSAKGPLTEEEFRKTDYMGGPQNLKTAIKEASEIIKTR